MMEDLSVLSFDSSIIREKGLLDKLVVVFKKWGESAPLTIAVVFVRPHANFFAISESGNIFGKSLVAWSLARKAILCLATNMDHRVSASIAPCGGLHMDTSDRDDVLVMMCLLSPFPDDAFLSDAS